MGEKLGLGNVVSMALGGMIGGGIYAVLGIVVAAAGAAASLAFLLAGVVAVCADYAYVALNRRVGHPGRAVVFVQENFDSPTTAGMVGWTLLVGYLGSMADPRKTLSRAVYVAIPVAVTISVAVALVTFALVPELVRQHPETALAVAAREFLGPIGRRVIGASALAATASAINATLFSSSLLTQRLTTCSHRGSARTTATASRRSRRWERSGGSPAPSPCSGACRGSPLSRRSRSSSRSAVCALALRNAGGLDRSRLPPAVGLVGCGALLPLVFRHEPATFRTVVAVAVVVGVELLYFPRPGLYKRVRESLTR